MESPRVFISYSHDSPEHRAQVLALSNRLRAGGIDGMGGIDCRIDQYEMAPDVGWPTWCDEQIEDSKFVLVICTHTYLKRFKKKEDPDRGFGVTFEGHVITQELYNGRGKNAKFIPVVFSDQDRASVPVTLQGAGPMLMPDDYETLYRRLTKQPAIEMPGLVGIKKLAPLSALPAKTAPILRPKNAALLCDRTKAVGHFRRKIPAWFSSTAPQPVICIAYAMALHRPDSLVQRLIDELTIAREGTCPVTEIPWERDFNEGDVRRALSDKLLGEAGGDEKEDEKPISAANFAKRLMESQSSRAPKQENVPPIIIRHSIDGWSAGKARVLEDYLRFWRDWPALEGGQRIFAFFVIEQRSIVSWLGTAKQRRELGSQEESMIFDKFEWIEDEHVRYLLNELGWAPPGARRDQLVARILGGRLRRAVGLKVRRSMTYVEQKLNAISGEIKDV